MVAMCKTHWGAMREAVAVRGMAGLVHQSGEALAAAQVRELQGQGSDADWDPLMAANWAIIGRMMDNIGRAMGPSAAIGFMASDECPLCMVQADYNRIKGKPAFDPKLHLGAQGWIDGVMDAMLRHARGRGLVPGIS